MPTYQYRCSDCRHEFEQVQKFSESALTVCPSCNGAIRRVIQPVGVVFKGSGWYITDSRKSETPATGNGKKADPSAKAESNDKVSAPEGSSKAESNGGSGASDGDGKAEKPVKAEPKDSAAPAKTAPVTAAAST